MAYISSSLPLIDDYEKIAPNLNGATLDWLNNLRKRSFNAFCSQGLPINHETWKYTRFKILESVGFKRTNEVIEKNFPNPIIKENVHIINIHNGKFADLSGDKLPEEIVVSSLSDVCNQNTPTWVLERLAKLPEINLMPFVALNTAWLEDGYIIDVKDNFVSEKPILIVVSGEAEDCPTVSHGRGLIRLGKNSKITVVEQHDAVAKNYYLSNFVCELYVEENSTLEHLRHYQGGEKVCNVGFYGARVSKNASLKSLCLQKGSALTRSELKAQLIENGAFCSSDGLYMASNGHHTDMTTFIDHTASHTTSSQKVRGVAGGNGRGVFQGKILVRKETSKVDGFQSHKGLLLSPQAEIDCKPELEIYADDVKCSHGATMGTLDNNALFYLRARGIGELEAKRLLTAAFLNEVLDEISNETIKEIFENSLHDWLSLNV